MDNDQNNTIGVPAHLDDLITVLIRPAIEGFYAARNACLKAGKLNIFDEVANEIKPLDQNYQLKDNVEVFVTVEAQEESVKNSENLSEPPDKGFSEVVRNVDSSTNNENGALSYDNLNDINQAHIESRIDKTDEKQLSRDADDANVSGEESDADLEVLDEIAHEKSVLGQRVFVKAKVLPENTNRGTRRQSIIDNLLGDYIYPRGESVSSNENTNQCMQSRFGDSNSLVDENMSTANYDNRTTHHKITKVHRVSPYERDCAKSLSYGAASKHKPGYVQRSSLGDFQFDIRRILQNYGCISPVIFQDLERKHVKEERLTGPEKDHVVKAGKQFLIACLVKRSRASLNAENGVSGNLRSLSSDVDVSNLIHHLSAWFRRDQNALRGLLETSLNELMDFNKHLNLHTQSEMYQN